MCDADVTIKPLSCDRTFNAFLLSAILFNLSGNTLISTVQGPDSPSCCAKIASRMGNPALGWFYMEKRSFYCTVTLIVVVGDGVTALLEPVTVTV